MGVQNGEGGDTGEAHPLEKNPSLHLNNYNTPKVTKSHCAPEPGRLKRKSVKKYRELKKYHKGNTP